MDEQRLTGGNAGGAGRAGNTVLRPAGPWTPAVHSLLTYLEVAQFPGVPKALGVDEQGREVLTYIAGETIGDAEPWPAWVYSDEALIDVGSWLRRYHDTVANFVPAPDAQWRLPTRHWAPGLIIGHNDAAPYNAVWRPNSEPGAGHTGRLVGFIDWDFAGPCPPLWDLAYLVFSWGPLHARDIVIAEGFTRFEDRPRRVRLLLDAYGYRGTTNELLAGVRTRVQDLSDTIQNLSDNGDPLFAQMVAAGTIDAQQRALTELSQDAAMFEERV